MPNQPTSSSQPKRKDIFKGSPRPTKDQAVESGEPTITGAGGNDKPIDKSKSESRPSKKSA